MVITLQIGGYTIQAVEPCHHRTLFWPFEPFTSFLIPPVESPDLAFRITVTDRLPELPKGRLLYDACRGLWKLYEADGGYLLDSPNRTTREPEYLAFLTQDFSQGDVFVLPERPKPLEPAGWTPLHLINPVVEVCLLTRLDRDGGLLLHAAGIVTECGGCIFTGDSGSGKSTLSDWFAQRGAQVLSDERVILRRADGRAVVWGTPWPGTLPSALNQASPLTSLFCIRHGTGNHALRRMTPRELAPFLLRQCFLPHWDREAMDHTLAFISEIIERTDCFELAFVKRPDIVDFLEDRHAGRTLTTP